MTNDYVCSQCGKLFSRKMAFSTNEAVLCKGCKRDESYKKTPGLKQQHAENRKAGLYKKYGVTNPSQLAEVKKKISDKALEKFNDPIQKASILDKRTATNIEKYGYAAAMQNPEIKQRNIDAQLKGTGYVGWQSKELLEAAQILAHSDEANLKRQATSLKNCGETHHFKNEEILGHQWDTYKERTGFDHPAHNPSVKQSIKGYQFEGEHFDSSWELAYFIWLRDNKKAFIYHPPFLMDYVDDEGKQHVYHPDFLVQGVFVEIKGDHFFNEKNEPYNCYEKAFWWNKYNALLEHNVKILRFEEVRQYLRYVKETYGKDFLHSFKRK